MAIQNELKPIRTRKGNGDLAIIEEAKERAQRGHEYWYDQWLEWKADVVFLGGEQWDAKAKAERTTDNRPVLTVNTFPQYIDQVMGDILQNRPAIHVSASDSDGGAIKVQSTDGVSNYSLAEAYEGIIRNIEHVSTAETHYDTAAQHSVESGMGYLRVMSRYCEGLSMDQELVIKGVRNRWSVIMDPDYEEPDGSDAAWAFVIKEYWQAEFRKRWPEAGTEVIADSAATADRHFVWATEAKIKVAEYFRREAMQRELVQLTSGAVTWLDELKGVEREDENGKKVKVDILPELAKEGITIHASRKVQTYKVIWTLLNGSSILEKDTVWPGTTIPIICVPGKRLDLEDGSLFRGLVYHAKDAKRADNYYISAAVERIGMAPKAPWVLFADEIEGHEAQWNEANVKNFAYLVVNRGADGSRPQRTEQSPMPAAELQMSALMTDRVKSTIGMYDAALGARSNEASGKAILARQRESDTSTFAFSDNLTKAIARVGKICCEVIPKIYDGTRTVRLRDRAGNADFVEFNKTVIDEETGAPVIVNDIAAAKMDVVARAGPSYNTQREEAAEAMLEFVRVVPAAGPIMLDKIAQNMDWPGADDIARRLIKMVPAQFLTDRERADNKIEDMKPTPAEQAEMMKQQGVMDTAKATSMTAEANMAQAQLEMKKLDSLAAGGDEQVQQIRDIVAETMAEVLASANAGTKPPAPESGKSTATKPATKQKGK